MAPKVPYVSRLATWELKPKQLSHNINSWEYETGMYVQSYSVSMHETDVCVESWQINNDFDVLNENEWNKKTESLVFVVYDL